jgi:hypothetical protein
MLALADVLASCPISDERRKHLLNAYETNALTEEERTELLKYIATLIARKELTLEFVRDARSALAR